eukprot:scaffold1557_cov189-Alexandrium_tamarense.AAC.4
MVSYWLAVMRDESRKWKGLDLGVCSWGEGGKSDDRTLESYAINAGATIHMVLQLRGGASDQC